MTGPVKLMFCLQRRGDLSREEFQAYWRESHGRLGVALADALGYARYVQSHTLSVPLNDALQRSRGGPPAYDGVVELWFDSVEAVQRTFGEPAGRAAAAQLLADEANFVDATSSPIFLVEEQLMWPSGGTAEQDSQTS